jgi:hypothetical protein
VAYRCLSSDIYQADLGSGARVLDPAQAAVLLLLNSIALSLLGHAREKQRNTTARKHTTAIDCWQSVRWLRRYVVRWKQRRMGRCRLLEILSAGYRRMMLCGWSGARGRAVYA